MERILYTRCSPWFDPYQKDAVSFNEGYGVSGVSEGYYDLLPSIQGKLFVKSISEEKCDEDVHEKLYEYLHLGNGVYALNAVESLPLCTTPRINGRTHRPIFLAEGILGRFAKKPGLYLTDANFPLDQISQNDRYAMDSNPNGIPPYLPSVNEESLTEVHVALPERLTASFCTILTYITEQLGKEETDQMPLFVRGDQSDVRDLVIAISEILPLDLARRFTFLTHTSSYRNNPERYAYYAFGEDGNLVDYTPLEPELKKTRHAKYLLIGHGNPNLVKGPMSEFETIDLDSGRSSIPSVSSRFLSSLAKKEQSALDFFALLSQKGSVRFDASTDELYSLYLSLIGDLSISSLSGAKSFAERFYSSLFASEETFRVRVEETIVSLYPKWIAEDAMGGFAFLHLALSLSKDMGNRLFALAYSYVIRGLDTHAFHDLALLTYLALDNGGYLSEEAKRDIAAHLNVSALPGPKSMDSSKTAYACLLLIRIRALGALRIDTEEGKAFEALFLQNLAPNNPVFLRLDAFLAKSGKASRDAIYSYFLQKSISLQAEEQARALRLCYSPSEGISKGLANEFHLLGSYRPFTGYERLLASAFAKEGKSAIDTFFEILEGYPEAKLNPSTGSVLSSFVFSSSKEAGYAFLERLVGVSEKAKENPDFQKLVASLGKEAVTSLFQGKGCPHRILLQAFEVNTPLTIASFVSAWESAHREDEQIASFALLGDYRFELDVNSLRTPLIQKILESLVSSGKAYEAFFDRFRVTKNPALVLQGFLETQDEKKKKPSEILLGLCYLALTDTPLGQEIKKELEEEDSELVKKFHSKKHQDFVSSIAPKDPKEKEALATFERLEKAYEETHLSFFARLFKKKPKDKKKE